MRKITYHVAITIDGFIAHSNHTADGFSFEGPQVTDYMRHLREYDTVIMGKGTYEAGYQFGMKPGDVPYPWMKNFVFSKTIHLPQETGDKLTVIRGKELETIARLKGETGSDIYLCGGGKFAGALLAAGLIDKLRLKVSPLVFGSGIKLFETADTLDKFRLDHMTQYENGVFLSEYTKI
jgi:dihydrofolate reductase